MSSVISIEPVVKKKTRPSRKGKKAWRKNVNITDVEKGLEEIRAEERITGGRISDLPDEKIFTFDTTGDINVKKKLDKKYAKLKIDQILENQSKIPAIFSKPSKSERPKYIKVGQLTTSKDSKDSKVSEPTNNVLRTKVYDVWDEKNSEESSQDEDKDFLHPAKKRKIKPPPTMNMKPPGNVPAVHVPHPGASYNPTFKDHQSLLKIAHEEEVVKLQKKEKLQSQLPVPSKVSSSAFNPEDMVDKDINEGKSSEDEIEDNERNDEIIKTTKSERKKTRAVRNKEKRKFSKLKEEQNNKTKKKFRKQLERLPEIIKNVEIESTEREKRQAEQAKAAEEKANLPLKKIGKYPVKKLPIDVQLQEELSESLRTLKPEGNLFRDRMVSLEERNIIEPRVKAKHKRKYKLREFVKSSYKNFN